MTCDGNTVSIRISGNSLLGLSAALSGRTPVIKSYDDKTTGSGNNHQHCNEDVHKCAILSGKDCPLFVT
jgi:hypothetical protein